MCLNVITYIVLYCKRKTLDVMTIIYQLFEFRTHDPGTTARIEIDKAFLSASFCRRRIRFGRKCQLVEFIARIHNGGQFTTNVVPGFLTPVLHAPLFPRRWLLFHIDY